MTGDFLDQNSLLSFVYLFHRFEEHHLRPNATHTDHSADVFRETGAAIADTGKDKMWADAPIESDGPSNLTHVRTLGLTESRDFVDKGYFRGQHRVRSVLAHLCTGAVHDENGVAGPDERFVKFFDYLESLRIVAPQHHPVRLHEVLHCRPFLEKLRIGDNRERMGCFLRHPLSNPIRRSDGHSAFGNNNLEAVHRFGDAFGRRPYMI